MKKTALIFSLFFMFAFASNEARSATSAKIVSGEIVLGGSGYGSPDYQTYASLILNVKRQNPQRDYRMSALQVYSVYLNHPIQPNGDFSYRVVMPYGPQSLSINGVSFYPVFYEDCKWTIRSSAITPKATPDSPQFVTVNSPFTMQGLSLLSGANISNFKFYGSGNARIIFEKARPEEYYFREATYTFTEESQIEKSK
ncbi:MAG TPA: hypothetical protein PKY59_23410 [Pyrinomonadaceae bacterium]|nr:hypothetical protein [Pyrinomonadaceae bacterium]